MSEWRMLGPEEVIQEGDEYSYDPGFKKCESSIGQTVEKSTYGVRRRVSPAKEQPLDFEAMKQRAEKAEAQAEIYRQETHRWKAALANVERINELANDHFRNATEPLKHLWQEHEWRPGIGGICEKLLAVVKERDESIADYEDLVRLLKKRFPQRPDGSLPDFAVEDVLKENEQLRAENERMDNSLCKIARGMGWQGREAFRGLGLNLDNYDAMTVAELEQALAAKACPHDSVNQGVHPDEGYMVVCKKCGEDLSPAKGETK